jgi:S1/P1 Nuclease
VTGRGRGGNDIRLRFNGRSTNLHSVWDGMLISKLQRTLNPVRIQYNQFLSYLLEELDSKYLNMTGRWLGCQVPARGGGQFVLQNPSASSHLVAQEDCVETWLEDTHRLNCNGVWSFDKPEIAREEYLIGRDYVQDYWAKEYGYESKHLEARVGQYFDIDLSQGEYWDWVWEEDIVQKMLIRGGVRLAGVLNRIFDS